MQGQSREAMDNKYREQMKAWMMIQVIGQTSINFLNVKKLAKEMRQHLATLLNCDIAEFADYFIDSCKDSKSYRAAIFGTMTMSDEGARTRLLEDIDQVTKTIPEKFGLEDSFEPIRIAFLNSLNRVQ
ncbi:hypothetical protein D6855_07040 [Butyrivibrio sp. CB08]|uniref:DUF6553 family protein n=1 Tax=Butyrivibrio sp. CB08 TaxID=2364879 RepID=UPI000EA8C7B7|nr:DUF6553 family protein [Butyrivibrio sp. CB08]RKM60465.1 hypothetical protein D6855_07040 [Butyrivibrio sp. CB08]